MKKNKKIKKSSKLRNETQTTLLFSFPSATGLVNGSKKDLIGVDAIRIW